MIKKVGQYIKHFRGAYKYAITQTFAIPTIDDAEKDKYSNNNDDGNAENEDNSSNTVDETTLNESNIEKMLGDPEVEDFENIFALGNRAG